MGSRALPAYAELWCLSNFSFLRGASRPEELVERAKALGYSALAMTDECSMAGVVRAHVAAKELGLPLILGSQFCIGHADADTDVKGAARSQCRAHRAGTKGRAL